LRSNARLTPAQYGRGFEQREPLDQAAADLPASAKGKAGPSFRASVPVYFHVVTDGSIGSLTSKQISDQVAVLNQNFGGSNTGFSFRLAGVTRTDNAAWFYAGPGGTDEHSMKHALRQGGDNALNLYSTTAGPYLGWAYLPDITTKPGQAYLDGIVFNWETVPGASTTWAGRYDLGKTVTHEAGHWLNLEHTFYGGCNAKGDFVADTPAERTPTSGCRRARTRVRLRGSTPSTTTWTTRTTAVTPSSLQARPSACATPGSSTAPRFTGDGPASSGPSPLWSAEHDLQRRRGEHS
jgi:Pregnancy-associated plasma protein-A